MRDKASQPTAREGNVSNNAVLTVEDIKRALQLLYENHDAYVESLLNKESLDEQ